MQRKSLTLLTIGLVLFAVFLFQMTVAQAAAPKQATTTTEPQPLPQPLRIRIHQLIPITISLAPAVPLSPTGAVSATAALSEAVVAGKDITGTTALTATDAITATGLSTETAAVAGDVTETVETAVSAVLTATAALTKPTMMTAVPVTLELDIDVVVTSTLTTTVPSTVTIQLPDFQTMTLPISVTISPLPDSEVVIELLPTEEPAVEETPTPEVLPTLEVTPTAETTATAAVTPTVEVTATTPAEALGLPLVSATVALSANLRTGPGTTFDIAGEAGPGQTVQIVATNEDGQWYLLSTGVWMANFLVTEQPANLPVATQELIDQVQGKAPAPTPTPAATEPLTTTPTVTPTGAVSPTTTIDANLRGGPGTEFDIIGGTVTGQALNIVGQNAEGTWFRLDNGGWVSRSLVADPPAPEGIPVLNADGTPVQPAATPEPTSTGLGGLLPTPTPQPVSAAGQADYVAAVQGIIGQYDVALVSVDQLIAEARASGALVETADWKSRRNAAVNLLNAAGATIGELSAPATLTAIQQSLIDAALKYIEAGEALSQVTQANITAQLDAVEAAIQQANASLTAAETAIAQGQ